MSARKRRRSSSFTPYGREGLRKGDSPGTRPCVLCPVCGVTVQAHCLEQHYGLELERLERRRMRKSSCGSGTHGDEGDTPVEQARAVLEGIRRRRIQFKHDQPGPSSFQSHDQPGTYSLGSHDQPGPSSLGSHDQPGPSPLILSDQPGPSLLGSHDQPGPSSDDSCPMCGERLAANEQERLSHVHECMGSEGGSDSDQSYEEYTWCNVTRVRATSMLDPTTRASLVNGTVIAEEGGGAEEVDVEEDTTDLYGPPQFSESDLIQVQADSGMERRVEGCAKGKSAHLTPPTSPKPVTYCLICMESYTRPLVSVQCWHVFCERCWLQAMGAQKLCPKCKTITCASDLRRIFL